MVWVSFQCPQDLDASTYRMANMRGLVTRILVLISTQCIVGLLAVTIHSDFVGLISVPQDIDVAVTIISLTHNNIVIIDGGSFPLYLKLNKLVMGGNPLE